MDRSRGCLLIALGLAFCLLVVPVLVAYLIKHLEENPEPGGAAPPAIARAAPAAAQVPAKAAPAAAAPADLAAEIKALKAEIELLKGKLPDQAHAMQDVGYHYSNLWFAGQAKHWDLAQFYWNETRSHLRWAVRIIPKRKDNAGQEVDLGAILQSLENSPLKDLEQAIKTKDAASFDKAYRVTLEGCYSCHKASAKPFLRPRVPANPETPIINFDPQADWPK